VSNRAFANNEDLALSQKEYALLQLLVQHPDKIIGAEHLYEKIWGQKMNGDCNALKKMISKLRAKLDGSGYTITASRGEGYCFEKV